MSGTRGDAERPEQADEVDEVEEVEEEEEVAAAPAPSSAGRKRRRRAAAIGSDDEGGAEEAEEEEEEAPKPKPKKKANAFASMMGRGVRTQQQSLSSFFGKGGSAAKKQKAEAKKPAPKRQKVEPKAAKKKEAEAAEEKEEADAEMVPRDASEDERIEDKEDEYKDEGEDEEDEDEDGDEEEEDEDTETAKKTAKKAKKTKKNAFDKLNGNGGGDDDDDGDDDDWMNDEELKELNLFGEADAAWSKRNADGTTTDNSLDAGDSKYDPVGAATWKRGQPVPYVVVARLWEKCSEDRGRLRLIGLLSDFFRTLIAVSPEQLLPAVYLCCNKLAPAYEGLETGVGETVLCKAISQATGVKVPALRKKVHEVGDLGEVALALRSTQRTMFPPPKLTLPGVYKTMRSLATMQGGKSVQKRKDAIQRMLVSARECETKYVVRALQGNLRIGVNETTVIHALCRAFTLTPPAPGGAGPPPVLDVRRTTGANKVRRLYSRACAIVKHVYTEVPSHDRVVPALLEHGYARLHRHVKLTPGVPVKAMLGRPTNGVAEVFERYPDMAMTFEWKYDGERAQVHMLPGGKVRIFSRNSEDHSEKYPDVARRLANAVARGGDGSTAVESFIIDCEVVAYDTREDRILPFQTLSTRKRKAVAGDDVTVQVCLFAFDMICLNGESFMRKPFRYRRQRLRETFREVKGELHFAHHLDSTDMDEIRAYMHAAMEGSCEGLMVKTLDRHAFYVPNKRNWLKIKKDYVDGMSDTVDLVPIGAWIGTGKRAGVYGAFLLACYDEETETYQSITKIGTGFKDTDLAQHHAFLKEHTVETCPPYYDLDDRSTPDVWFEPCQVWEVKAADLSISPVHRAAVGTVDPARGIALRFPRFMRIRDDKNSEDCTSAAQIADMYLNQSVVRNNAAPAAKPEAGADGAEDQGEEAVEEAEQEGEEADKPVEENVEEEEEEEEEDE